MKITDQIIKDFDIGFWKFKKELELFHDFTPLNQDEEKLHFQHLFHQNIRYNPQFIYKKINHPGYASTLETFIRKLKAFTDWPLQPVYIELCTRTSQHLHFFHRRDQADFLPYLSGLYAEPTDAELTSAQQIIKNRTNPVNNNIANTIKAQDAALAFSDALKQRFYNDWTVEITKMVADVAVNSLQKKLKINENAFFSEERIRQLIIHEIDTHILRSHNGAMQSYKVFQYGFPDYLETEEGLAIYNEHLNGCLSDKNLYRYALRLIMAKKALTSDFYELFTECFELNFNDFDKAWKTCLRLKRGLSDTSLHAAYVKDLVYYRGFLKMQQQPKEIIHRLYIGKIGLENLPMITNGTLTLTSPNLPAFYNE
ncbi:MAG: DUF1704 domain-containing protein [Bacteroidales bacterium]|nr:DUF1704 domain-containing protein [Bacteroidales bacterium]